MLAATRHAVAGSVMRVSWYELEHRRSEEEEEREMNDSSKPATLSVFFFFLPVCHMHYHVQRCTHSPYIGLREV